MPKNNLRYATCLVELFMKMTLKQLFNLVEICFLVFCVVCYAFIGWTNRLDVV